ncbi:hypothetical protein [Pseudoroseomonas ludipueritiae]|uniref:Uncharacterized protein n=1 Tax=Pseudoroseomonas ludipueritiae TaxID=198093 RepID=A0ABR7REN4_9PROT|nr:hypothetical protein [Pseudoroseomonas ludipueritiae]MBC9180341.1 hypothetical protein [Pseudoroseomonas ludipueritiae]MCG7362410.1 hypothetical protein [Roseomonas sp. ACRSG]
MSGTGKPEGGATPQGLGAQGPGNAHGTPSAHERDTEDKPFDPEGGRPASDTEAMARKVLDYANKGPRADGDPGPEAEGKKPGG